MNNGFPSVLVFAKFISAKENISLQGRHVNERLKNIYNFNCICQAVPSAKFKASAEKYNRQQIIMINVQVFYHLLI